MRDLLAGYQQARGIDTHLPKKKSLEKKHFMTFLGILEDFFVSLQGK